MSFRLLRRSNMSDLAKKRCIPCEEGGEPMTEMQALEMVKQVNDWSLIDEGRLLAKSFHFNNFTEVMVFVNKVAEIAQVEGHHPDMTVSYDHVGIELMTHAAQGLTENDFILASKIDQIKL